MGKINVSKQDVRRAGGFENYLRENGCLRDDVSLDRIKDGGMYGNRIFVWNTPNGQVKCSGYISSSLGGVVSYWKMNTTSEQNKALFEQGDELL